MASKLKKRFIWQSGTIEIRIVDWDDGTPLGYVWFGTVDRIGEGATYAFDLNTRQAITLAENIIKAAKIAKRWRKR